jgi:hypothetical protein
MKFFIIVLAVVILLIVIFQSFIIMPTVKTEKQKYSLISKYRGFEIRFYPSVKIANTGSKA